MIIMTKDKIRNKIKQVAICILAVLLYSCSTPKDIAYFQDAAALNGMALQMEQKFRLRPEDKINIIVNSSNPLLEQQFTLTSKTGGNSMLGADVKPETTTGGISSGNGMLLHRG